MTRVPKVPETVEAWASLRTLSDQDANTPDVSRADYVGQMRTGTLAAVLLDLDARLRALEAAVPRD